MNQLRRALIVALVNKSSKPLGRTAIMKLMFFAQEIRNVPLRYKFKIYTYGPYDAEVLSDLSIVRAQDAVISGEVRWPSGTSVVYARGPKADDFVKSEYSLLSNFDTDVSWLIEEFGDKSAKELELLSTIVFLYKSGVERDEEISHQTHKIKPHFASEAINTGIEALRRKSLLVHNAACWPS